MTLEEARKRIDEIGEAAPSDYEKAHALEDAFHRDVLRAIANDTEHRMSEAKVRHLAWLAASTVHIPFERHAA